MVIQADVQTVSGSAISGSTINDRELALPSRSERAPEFFTHSRAIALQVEMIRAKLLDFVNQSRQATISHW